MPERTNRRMFLQRAFASAAALASTRRTQAADAADLKPIYAQIEKRHDEAVQRLQDWIRQPSIAAENRGMTEGCDLMMRLLRDAGAPRTVGVYFMYDVKQADPSEWSSP